MVREALDEEGIDHKGIPGQRNRISGPAADRHLEALETDWSGRQQDPYRVFGQPVVSAGPWRIAERLHLDADHPGGGYSRHHERPKTVGSHRRYRLTGVRRDRNPGEGDRLQIGAVAHARRSGLPAAAWRSGAWYRSSLVPSISWKRVDLRRRHQGATRGSSPGHPAACRVPALQVSVYRPGCRRLPNRSSGVSLQPHYTPQAEIRFQTGIVHLRTRMPSTPAPDAEDRPRNDTRALRQRGRGR